MKRRLPAPVRIAWLTALLSASLSAGAQSFEAFLEGVRQMPDQATRQLAAEQYFRSVASFPARVNDTTVRFIYKGDARSVNFTGDPTGWRPGAGFNRIKGTDLWYLTACYPADARVEYKLLLDSSKQILDPLNANIFKGGMGSNSELRMPGYTEAPETRYYGEIAHGRIWTSSLNSRYFGADRIFKAYLPPGYDDMDTARYPVILFNDGLEFLTLAHADRILDYLIANHRIRPVIAVFVPPVDRGAEFSGHRRANYAKYVTTEVMPVIDSMFRTSMNREDRAVCGISDGGNIALFTGIHHPDCFGKIAALSSSVQDDIRKKFNKRKSADLMVYLDLGIYDIRELYPWVLGLKEVLQQRGYPNRYYLWHDGHSWGNWKDHLRYPLEWFFSGQE